MELKPKSGTLWGHHWDWEPLYFIMMERNSGCSTYPVEEVHPAHHPDLGGVVDEANVALRGSVQFPDFDISEALQELGPDIGADAVPDGELDSVVFFIPLLKKTKQQNTIKTHLGTHCTTSCTVDCVS